MFGVHHQPLVRERDAFLSPHGLVALRRLARLAEEEISRLTSPVSRRKVLCISFVLAVDNTQHHVAQ
jgi:hypothetical protein